MSLITRHRPKHWDEVIGNNALINSILSALHLGDSRAFLLYGNTGCGKTTIARLSAKEVGTEDENIIEIDAATENGVEDMRKLTALLNYKPLRGTTRSIIIDECQAITTQAWKALLKSIEEPPEGTYWFLCTTEPVKVPSNIMSRCTQYQVSTLTRAQLHKLLSSICELENKEVSSEVISLCASEAKGSPRCAISFLAQVDGLSLEEAKEIIRQETGEENDIYALADFLVNKKPDWSRTRLLLRRVEHQNPETVRRVIEAYLVKVLLDTPDADRAFYLLALLEDFSKPINTNSIAPIILAATRSLGH